jgi:hypothetical protein
MSSLFRVPDGENLVTYYILPLVGVNKKTFSKHFKSSYIDKTGLKVYVELRSNMVAPIYKQTPCYNTEILINNIKYVQFDIPIGFLNDTAQFIGGTYSLMSKDAKKIIYKTCTLPYNATMGSFSVSHPVLQALDKTKTLRAFLLKEFEGHLADNGELIDSPEDDWFIEHRIKL